MKAIWERPARAFAIYANDGIFCGHVKQCPNGEYWAWPKNLHYQGFGPFGGMMEAMQACHENANYHPTGR